MIDLNEKQKEAVESSSRRLLIIAGAGSGKTRVIVSRIAHLIKNKNVESKSILGLTFTNKAVDHMKSRIRKSLGNDLDVNIFTFHSYCLFYLRQNIHKLGYDNNFSLYSEYESKRVLNNLSKDICLQTGEDIKNADKLCYKLILDRKAGKFINENYFGENEFLKLLWERFQLAMSIYNAVDFNGLLELTLKLWEKDTDSLEEEKKKYSHILVDEFQDTDPIQEKIIKMLSGDINNICVVGDDDQAIYEWRGACINHILNFEHDELIKLEHNYRSTKNILNCANSVISNNTLRHKKSLISTLPEGPKVEVFHAPDDDLEAMSVVERIANIRGLFNLSWSSFAILFRSNLLAKKFESALTSHVWTRQDGACIRGIPYRVFGGSSMYDARESKDICAYVSVMVNPKDQIAILRCINEPNRGIGELTLEKILKTQKETGEDFFEILKKIDMFSNICNRAKLGIISFVELISNGQNFLKSNSLDELIKWIIINSGYDKTIEESKTEKIKKRRQSIINELINSAKIFQQTYPEGSDINVICSDFIAASNLNVTKFKSKNIPLNCVTLSTFHAVKGLEFPICFITCSEEDIIPHSKSIDENKIEEERRLMYVAITRSMRYLCISMSVSRKRGNKKDNKRSPSRFLYEMPKDCLNTTSWSEVPDYGYLYDVGLSF